MSERFLYVIAHIRNRQMSGPVKVGVTGTPLRRLEQLQTGSPHQLVLLHAFRCDVATAGRCERLIHKAFAPRNAVGEWFDVDPLYAVIAAAFLVSANIEDVFGLTAEQSNQRPEVPDFIALVRQLVAGWPG